MKKLGYVIVAIAALAASGCGGSSSTPAPPAPTPTPTPAPPGALALAYAGTPGTLVIPAATLTGAIAASQPNYTGAFTAAVSPATCNQVTVAPASAANGAFTVTGAYAATAAAGCTVTVTGAPGTTPVAVPVTVTPPGGIVLRWYLPNYTTFNNPQPIAASPINMAGTGPAFAVILAVSEANYVGGFPAASVVAAGCAGIATLTPSTSTPVGLPTAPPNSSLGYFTVTGVAASASGCSITASDGYVPDPVPPSAVDPAATISVQITSATGVVQ